MIQKINYQQVKIIERQLMVKKELLFSVTKKDLEIQTFRCGGHGGQKVNKTSSGVRIIHKESGAVGESRTERSQYQNKKIAFIRLTKSQKFKLWIQKKVFEVTYDQRKIERKVDEDMKSENLKVEVKHDNIWIELDKDDEN